MSGGSWRPDHSANEETPSRFVKGATSTNWRDRPPAGMAQMAPNAPVNPPGTQTPIHFMGQRNSKEFTEGKIIIIWNYTTNHKEVKRDEIDRQKEDLLTPDIPGLKGVSIFVKTRRVIIISRSVSHYVALPIYSHGGRGVDSKPEVKDEYISIRDRISSGGNLAHSAQGGCLYTTTKSTDDEWRYMGEQSNVWFTHPMSLGYGDKIHFVAKLESESLSHLCELYMTATKKALLNSLNGINPPFWSPEPNSLGSEKRRLQASKAESDKKNNLTSKTQPVNQTYSGAAASQTNWRATKGQTPSKTTGFGFQPLKRTREPEPSNEPFGNPAKRAKE
ncbi:hypothetical protein V490_07796 [Pseudogymnoascus sp. VKM F-3557]|nr:hypothetical protein V490_07796 [Pseudogymnoascus sp. VKM F-3557]